MRKVLVYIMLPLLSVILLAMTGESGFWKVEKSESFIKHKDLLKNNKIIFFPPEVTSISVIENVDRNFSSKVKFEAQVRKQSKWAWKKNKIQAVYLDEMDDLSLSFKQYQKILALRREIILANNLQNHPLDNYNLEKNDISQSVFVNTPQIDFGYGDLKKEVESPYFALTGYLSYQIKPKNAAMRNFIRNSDINGYGNFHYYYCVIVNVESGEIIYREFKKLPLKLDMQNIKQFLYESYFVFSKNIRS